MAFRGTPPLYNRLKEHLGARSPGLGDERAGDGKAAREPGAARAAQAEARVVAARGSWGTASAHCNVAEGSGAPDAQAAELAGA